MEAQTRGIYLNTETNKVVRIVATPNVPTGKEWIKISDDPNTGLLTLRRLANEKNLSSSPDTIDWA